MSLSSFKCFFKLTQPANIGPQDVPRTSPSNTTRTSPKNPGDIPNQPPRDVPWKTFSGRPFEDLFFKGRFVGTMWGHLLDVPKFLFTLLSELIRLTKSI